MCTEGLGDEAEEESVCERVKMAFIPPVEHRRRRSSSQEREGPEQSLAWKPGEALASIQTGLTLLLLRKLAAFGLRTYSCRRIILLKWL